MIDEAGGTRWRRINGEPANGAGLAYTRRRRAAIDSYARKQMHIRCMLNGDLQHTTTIISKTKRRHVQESLTSRHLAYKVVCLRTCRSGPCVCLFLACVLSRVKPCCVFFEAVRGRGCLDGRQWVFEGEVVEMVV